jgi:hypothetical protein
MKKSKVLNGLNLKKSKVLIGLFLKKSKVFIAQSSLERFLITTKKVSPHDKKGLRS